MASRRARATGSASEGILYGAAPLLVLAAPFAGFLQAAGYPFARTESLVSFAAFVPPALLFAAVLLNTRRAVRTAVLVLLLASAADFLVPLADARIWLEERLDIGRSLHAAIAVAAAFVAAAVLALLHRRAVALCALGFGALTVWFVIGGLAERSGPASAAAAAGDDAPAPLVHIVLDGHGAVSDGDAARYAERGFRVYRRAYSQYYDAANALPALLNLDVPERDSAWLDRRRSGNPTLTAAAYFEYLAGRGWRVDVRGTNRRDLCAAAPAAVATCTVHDGTAGALAAADPPFLDELGLLWGLYLERLDVYRAARAAWRRHAVPALRRLGIDGPAWSWRVARLDSLAAPAIAAATIADFGNGGPGRAWIVDFPATAPPYAWDAGCALIRESARWLGPYDRAQTYPRRNDRESLGPRNKRFAAHQDCAHARLGAILDAIDEAPALAGATVLIHGLHGSHIVEHAPTVAAEGQAGAADYAGGFATFLAVRAPGLAPGVDERPTPLQATFPTFLGAPAAGGAQVLYLRGRPGGPLAPRSAETVLGTSTRE